MDAAVKEHGWGLKVLDRLSNDGLVWPMERSGRFHLSEFGRVAVGIYETWQRGKKRSKAA